MKNRNIQKFEELYNDNLSNEEKQKSIDIALSKLTEYEKELLGLIKKPKTPKNYIFKIYYMIGDADGNTSKKGIISIDNPFLSIITNALNKIKPRARQWGILLEDETYLENYRNKNINELEYELLCLVSNYNEDDTSEFFKKFGFDNVNSKINDKFLSEFEGILISDAEYSYLSYEKYKLKINY